jgi:hypothetical protein
MEEQTTLPHIHFQQKITHQLLAKQSLHIKKNPGCFVHTITVKELTPFIPSVIKSQKLHFRFKFNSMLRFYTQNALKLWHMQELLNTKM